VTAVPTPQNFDAATAAQRAESGKLAMLNAIATGGTAAAQQLAQQQSAVQQAGQQLQGSLTSGASQMPGDTSAFQAGQQSNNAAITNAALSAAQMTGAANQQQASILSDAATQQTNQIQAAVPIARETTQRQLDSIQAGAQQKSDDRDMQRGSCSDVLGEGAARHPGSQGSPGQAGRPEQP